MYLLAMAILNAFELEEFEKLSNCPSNRWSVLETTMQQDELPSKRNRCNALRPITYTETRLMCSAKIAAQEPAWNGGRKAAEQLCLWWACWGWAPTLKMRASQAPLPTLQQFKPPSIWVQQGSHADGIARRNRPRWSRDTNSSAAPVCPWLALWNSWRHIGIGLMHWVQSSGFCSSCRRNPYDYQR